MQGVVLGGVQAHCRVDGAEGSPGVGGGADAVGAVHVALVDRDVGGAGAQDDHGVAAAVAAAHLEEVAGSGLGQEVLQRTVAAGGEIGQSAHLAGFGGIDVEFVVVGLFGGGADVVAEQLLKDRLGEALALLGVIGAAIGGAGLVVAAGVGAVHHLIQTGLDLLCLSAGSGGRGGHILQRMTLGAAAVVAMGDDLGSIGDIAAAIVDPRIKLGK